MALNLPLSVFGRYGRLYTLPTYNFVKIVWFEDRIVWFSFDSSFYINNISIEEIIHFSLFLSLASTGIDVNDIMRYPSSSLKNHLTSILTVF